MQVVTERSIESVEIDDVEIRAGRGRLLVSTFSWRHQAGSVAWIMGENGTGKSSLLRVLAGCSRPSSGGIRWQNHVTPIRYYAPLMSAPDDLAVGDWLELIASLQTDIGICDDVERIRPEASPRRRFKHLSTGEAKRLLLWALLRPLNGALILDEPYEHLSPDAKAILTSVLRTIAAGSVVIVATNQEIVRAADEPLLVLDGSEVRVLS